MHDADAATLYCPGAQGLDVPLVAPAGQKYPAGHDTAVGEMDPAGQYDPA